MVKQEYGVWKLLVRVEAVDAVGDMRLENIISKPEEQMNISPGLRR